ncbi:MAG TPA: hypothetical protein VGA36_06690 [Nitriliruptorales bacterium]
MVRPRYRQQVTPDDVGSRVSVRRWVEDADRGPVPSDVVGRLVAWDGGTLRIRRRDDTLVEVAANEVLASRVIPEHPRLDPERDD